MSQNYTDFKEWVDATIDRFGRDVVFHSTTDGKGNPMVTDVYHSRTHQAKYDHTTGKGWVGELGGGGAY